MVGIILIVFLISSIILCCSTLNCYASLCCNVDVSACDQDGHTALHVACKRGITVLVETLLSHVNESEVNKTDSHKNTPLHTACVQGNKGIVRSLMKKGADLTLKNNNGRNPLQVAVVHKHVEVVEMILSSDMPPEHKEHLLKETDNDDNSNFLLAVKSGEEKMVQLFLTKATITDKNRDECNAFHLAAAINQHKIMKMIYDYDSVCIGLLNKKDKDGKTPLHRAAMSAHDQIHTIQFLIEK